MAKVVASFWKGKRVFLTGHTGFKGSWLAVWLNSMGAKVHGYALGPTNENDLFNELGVGRLVESEINDIRNLRSLSDSIKEFQPEIVLHMAAQALVKYSYEFPVETFETNVMGTINTLEACRKVQSIKAIVNVTSDKCYENKEQFIGYKEADAMGGYDPYSSSKGCAELVTSSYRRSFFNTNRVGLASARAGNVIGGGDWAKDRLVPDFFRAVLNRKEVLVRNPNAIRPWQHVLEPLSGYLNLAHRLYERPANYSKAFNFGPNDNDATTVEFLVGLLSQNWGEGARYSVEKNDGAPHEAGILKLNIELAKKELNWNPTWDIRKAVQATVSWYKQYEEDRKGLLDFTVQQISNYQNQ